MNREDLTFPLESSKPRSLRKAVLWGTGQFLSEAVELLLSTEPTLEIIKLVNEGNKEYLLEWVAQAKPHVVILCQESDETDMSLLLRLLQTHADLRIIVLSLESNIMQIYTKHNSFMRSVSDLLSVVEMNHCE